MILSIDPSSSAIGVALFTADGKNLNAFALTPNYFGAASLQKLNMLGNELQSYIDDMEKEHGAKVEIVVIEIPPTHQGFKSNPGAQHQAFGVVGRVLYAHGIKRIYEVHPATWTHNKPKQHRQWKIRQKLGLLNSQDKGGDAVDALMLGQWWIAQNKHRLLQPAEVNP